MSKTVKERVKRAVASMPWGSRGHRGSGEGGGVWGKAWGLEKGARPRGPGRARWGGGCEGGTPRLELCCGPPEGQCHRSGGSAVTRPTEGPPCHSAQAPRRLGLLKSDNSSLFTPDF